MGAFLNFNITLVIVAMLFYISSVGLTEMHEKAHQAIYKNYGISSNVTINYNPLTQVRTGVAGYTIADSSEIDKCNENCEGLQSLNEIVSYNVSCIIDAMFCSVLIIAFMVFLFQTSRQLRQLKDESKEKIEKIQRINQIKMEYQNALS